MFGKWFIIFFLFFWSVSCARPQYLDDSKVAELNAQFEKGLLLEFDNGELLGSVTWIETPSESKKGSFLLRVYKLDSVDGFPILEDFNTSPEVKLWMPSMNHGSTPVTVTSVGVGTYRVSEVFFIMPGEWEILVKLKKEQSVTNASLKVTL